MLVQYIWVRFLPFAPSFYNVPVFPFSAYKDVREKYLAEMRFMLHHMQYVTPSVLTAVFELFVGHVSGDSVQKGS